MKIIVNGGNGFIGSHFVAKAASQGHEVVVCEYSAIPRYAHGYPFKLIPGGLQALIDNIDIVADADIICQFASSTNPATSNLDPVGDIEDNLVQNIRLFEAMRQVQCKRVLYISSGGAIYGKPLYVPINEEHPQRPTSSYGIVKGATEQFLELYSTFYDFKPAIVRPSNPYGLGQDPSAKLGVISSFLDCAKRGLPITLYGDGTIVRDFVFIDDLIDLLLRVVEQTATGVFNCGYGQGVSLAELIDVISDVIGRPLERRYEAGRLFDPPVVVLDIERAKAQLGWEPKVPLAEGIKRIWESLQ